MKIAINLKDTDGSFGGGNYFIKSLSLERLFPSNWLWFLLTAKLY